MAPARIIVALLFAWCAGPLAARQVDTLSQIPLPGDNNLRLDPSRFLKDRELLKRLTQDGDLQKLLGGLRDPANSGSALQQLLGKYPEFRDPERLNGLKEMAERMIPNSSSLKPSESSKFLETIKERFPGRFPPPPKFDRNEPFPPRFNNRDIDRRNGSTNPQRLSTNSDLARWVQRNLGDRPEWNEMLKDINSRIATGDWQKSELMGRFEGELKDLGSWISRQNFDIPKIRGPNLNLNVGGGLSLAMPSAPSPAMPGGGSMYGLGFVALAGLGVLWYKYAKSKPILEDSKESDAERSVGRIRSMRIDSGRDLIAAYESVALHCLGTDALHSNHRTIDLRLKERMPGHSLATGALTALYEKARYATTNADLNATELGSARAHLRSMGEALR